MKPIQTEIVVIGAGPGGYAAAYYAADRGKKVMLVDQDKRLGGVCLNRGCIPSKALLHASKIIHEAAASAKHGITFGEPKLDLAKLRAWKEASIDKLSAGIRQMGEKRGVELVKGRGIFDDSKTLRVETPEGQRFVRFEHAIVAVGSKPALPKVFDLGNPRIMTSTEALELEDVPQELLVVGGGYIGMELGTVYATLGSKVTVIEALPSILSGADPDLARPVMRYAEKNFKQVRLGAKVTKMATSGKQIKVHSEVEGKPLEELYDRVLISVGRVPNCADLGLQHTRVERDEKGFIRVDTSQRTADPGIWAIGDVAGGLMLAHKAAAEARIAVDAICGDGASNEHLLIPAVVFTDPEVAWVGLTESEARQKGIEVKVAKFPWGALGRAISTDKSEGLTKLVVDPDTERILGVGLVGEHAGDMIAEGALAIEMGATALDLAKTVHPHPTFSETMMEAAEVFYGHSVHTLAPKR